jgi:hypothetical protein
MQRTELEELFNIALDKIESFAQAKSLNSKEKNDLYVKFLGSECLNRLLLYKEPFILI